MKKILTLTLCLALLLGLFSGCGGKQYDPLAGVETTVFTDDAGRDVTVPADITRIAASGSTAQMILMTLVPELLVGLASSPSTAQRPYFPAEMWTLPTFGQFYGSKANLNMEALIDAEPQLIVDLGDPKENVRSDMDGIQKQTGITFVFVTHDQEEALSMSDTVVVMSEGKIHQIGTPVDIYNEPQNAFVADFIGESNILDGVMLEDYKVTFSGQTFQCLDKDFAKNEAVDVVVRPEDVDIVPLEKGQLTGVVTSVTFMGVHYEIIVDVGGFKWMIQTTDFVDVDEQIGIELEPDAIHIMKKSEYSDLYGDYSSFSNELDELSEVSEEEDE